MSIPATKEAYESILRYYADAQGLRACVLKLYDTYGAVVHHHRLYSRQSVKSGKPMGMSPGEQKIDLLHVKDVVAAFLIAGERVRNQGSGGIEEFYLRSRKNAFDQRARRASRQN